MEAERKIRISPQLVLGVLVVVAGVLFTLDNLGILYAEDYLRFWPAGLILLGLVKYGYSDNFPGRLAGGVFAVAGGLILMANLGWIDANAEDFLPLGLVLVGALLVWQAMRRRERESETKGTELSRDNDSIINGIAVMGGFSRTSNAEDFRGGELTAFMGGCEIDLTRASIESGDAEFNVFVMWGGIEIRVPEDWTVVVKALPIMGGFVDKTRPPREGKKKRLVIRGMAIMGGFEVRN